VGYGLVSFAYRLLITFSIVIFMAGKYFVAGVVFAIWAITTQILRPVTKWISFLLFSPNIQRARGRAMSTSATLILVCAAIVCMVPAPLWTRAEGVLWLPERAQVRAGTDAFIVKLLAKEGSVVQRGDPLVEAHDAFLETQLKVLEAQFRELKVRFAVNQYTDRVRAQIIRDESSAVEAELTRMQERIDDLIIRSPSNGVFVVPEVQDLPGRFVRQGEPLAYVVDFDDVIARVVVSQEEIGLIRQRTQGIELKLADQLSKSFPAFFQREVPAGSDRLPSKALGKAGGGDFDVDPLDEHGTRTQEKVFQFDLTLPPDIDVSNIGGRVYARFDHGKEPLIRQWYRQFRQLFLRQIES
jgi:putative peptide zinc metalloprotease protein